MLFLPLQWSILAPIAVLLMIVVRVKPVAAAGVVLMMGVNFLPLHAWMSASSRAVGLGLRNVHLARHQLSLLARLILDAAGVLGVPRTSFQECAEMDIPSSANTNRIAIVIHFYFVTLAFPLPVVPGAG